MNRPYKVALFVGVAVLTVALAIAGSSRLASAATPGTNMQAMIEDGSANAGAAHLTNTLQGTSVFTVTVGDGGARFTPDRIIIPAGSTVRWVWAADGHTVTSGAPGNPDGLFCSPNDQNCSANPTSAAGSVYEHTFTIAGDYPYYCRIHGSYGMTGMVIATDIANPTTLFLPIVLN